MNEGQLCRWCHHTEAAHLPPTQANRPRMRCPCLGWQEHFVPRQGPSVKVRVETVPSVEVTDAQRLAVVRELWALHNASGRVHMDQTLADLERQIKERAGL